MLYFINYPLKKSCCIVHKTIITEFQLFNEIYFRIFYLFRLCTFENIFFTILKNLYTVLYFMLVSYSSLNYFFSIIFAFPSIVMVLEQEIICFYFKQIKSHIFLIIPYLKLLSYHI